MAVTGLEVFDALMAYYDRHGAPAYFSFNKTGNVRQWFLYEDEEALTVKAQGTDFDSFYQAINQAPTPLTPEQFHNQILQLEGTKEEQLLLAFDACKLQLRKLGYYAGINAIDTLEQS